MVVVFHRSSCKWYFCTLHITQDKGEGSMSQEQEFMFYDLPPFKMPEKELNQ